MMPRQRQFEPPFQIWADLRTPALKAFHPISEALYDLKYQEDQKRQGIIPLSECHIVAELPRG